jgi:hypothetical protein
VHRLPIRRTPFCDQHSNELFDLPDAPRPDPHTPAPPRFLPDTTTCCSPTPTAPASWATSTAWGVFTSNGRILGTVLIDGFVSGKWRITRHRSAATLVVAPFKRLSKKDTAALTREGARLLTFAAADADTRNIQFTPPE